MRRGFIRVSSVVLELNNNVRNRDQEQPSDGDAPPTERDVLCSVT